MAAIVADLPAEIATMRITAILRREGYSFLPRHLKNRLEYLRERNALRKRLAKCATERGTVFVHNSGRDCDGVTHSTLKEFPANLDSYERAIHKILDWADGPEWFDILTPAQAARFKSEPSRDLHAEAHENGHPHVIYD